MFIVVLEMAALLALIVGSAYGSTFVVRQVLGMNPTQIGNDSLREAMAMKAMLTEDDPEARFILALHNHGLQANRIRNGTVIVLSGPGTLVGHPSIQVRWPSEKRALWIEDDARAALQAKIPTDPNDFLTALLRAASEMSFEPNTPESHILEALRTQPILSRMPPLHMPPDLLSAAESKALTAACVGLGLELRPGDLLVCRTLADLVERLGARLRVVEAARPSPPNVNSRDISS